MYIVRHNFSFGLFSCKLALFVSVNVMTTKDEGRNDGISTALRKEEMKHKNKNAFLKTKYQAPWAPFGVLQWPYRVLN